MIRPVDETTSKKYMKYLPHGPSKFLFDRHLMELKFREILSKVLLLLSPDGEVKRTFNFELRLDKKYSKRGAVYTTYMSTLRGFFVRDEPNVTSYTQSQSFNKSPRNLLTFCW